MPSLTLKSLCVAGSGWSDSVGGEYRHAREYACGPVDSLTCNCQTVIIRQTTSTAQWKKSIFVFILNLRIKKYMFTAGTFENPFKTLIKH